MIFSSSRKVCVGPDLLKHAWVGNTKPRELLSLGRDCICGRVAYWKGGESPKSNLGLSLGRMDWNKL